MLILFWDMDLIKNERGLKYEEYFKSEEEALEKLYKKVKFCYRTIK